MPKLKLPPQQSLPPQPKTPSKSPKIAIIGGGIAGMALALSLQHNEIPNVTLYERDTHFDARKPGYGLTYNDKGPLAALKILEDCAIMDVPSRSHYIFDHLGRVRGYFGSALDPAKSVNGQRGNLRVPRQQLRGHLLDKLSVATVQWNKKLASITSNTDTNSNTSTITFSDGTSVSDVTLIIGADGINSTTRTFALPPSSPPPLNDLGVFVILGMSTFSHDLILNKGFYTIDSSSQMRLFTMPFSNTETMWQLSFVVGEGGAISKFKNLDSAGLKQLALSLCEKWHHPVPSIIAASSDELVWATSLFDIEPMIELHAKNNTSPNPNPPSAQIILIGDAQHAMSPFKGQGANQSITDATQLSQLITKHTKISSSNGNLSTMLRTFEREMNQRTRVKVLASREAIANVHTTKMFSDERKFADLANSDLRGERAKRARLFSRSFELEDVEHPEHAHHARARVHHHPSQRLLLEHVATTPPVVYTKMMRTCVLDRSEHHRHTKRCAWPN